MSTSSRTTKEPYEQPYVPKHRAEMTTDNKVLEVVGLIVAALAMALLAYLIAVLCFAMGEAANAWIMDAIEVSRTY